MNVENKVSKSKQRLRRLMPILYMLLNQLSTYATAIGLKKGHQNYQKYVLLGRSRVGSTLLARYLNSHVNIIQYGLIFLNENSKIGKPFLGNERKALELKKRSHSDFIKKYIYRNYPTRLQAVGFKLFYDHANNDSFGNIWSTILSDPNIKILHMKRRNLLRNILSAQIAKKTGEYIHFKGNSQSKAVTLEPAYLEMQLLKLQAQHSKYDDLFSNHSCMDIYYEDLVNNASQTLLEIQQFLGVHFKMDLSASLEKQNIEPLRELIINYDEVDVALKRLNFSWMLND